jgi:hypothetical protein
MVWFGSAGLVVDLERFAGLLVGERDWVESDEGVVLAWFLEGDTCQGCAAPLALL